MEISDRSDQKLIPAAVFLKCIKVSTFCVYLEVSTSCVLYPRVYLKVSQMGRPENMRFHPRKQRRRRIMGDMIIVAAVGGAVLGKNAVATSLQLPGAQCTPLDSIRVSGLSDRCSCHGFTVPAEGWTARTATVELAWDHCLVHVGGVLDYLQRAHTSKLGTLDLSRITLADRDGTRFFKSLQQGQCLYLEELKLSANKLKVF